MAWPNDSPCIVASSSSSADGILDPSSPYICSPSVSSTRTRAENTHSVCPGAPRTPSSSLPKSRLNFQRRLIPQRNIDHPMSSKRRHSRQRGSLLSTTLRSSANEQPNILTPEATRRPLLAGCIPEGLPLCREISEPGGDAEEERVVFLKGGGVYSRIGGFGTCVKLGENFFWECLADSEDIKREIVCYLVRTYWKISASIPALFRPAFSASARILTWPYMEYWIIAFSYEVLSVE